MEWQKELKNCITNAEELCDKLELPAEEREKYEKIISKFPMMITPYYFSLIDVNDPDDPIAKMCIPSEAELLQEGSFDTSGEGENTKWEGVQHKYTQTALILSTNVCAMYCRHCFRKRLVGLSDAELNKKVDEAAAYVKEHPEVTNVLITGGDALMNPNAIISRYLSEFTEIENLDFIRFGSRVPVTFPQRIYEDNELLDLFEKYASVKPIYVVTQFNHPREITPESIRAVKELQSRGIQVRNQSVLLKGVNDDPNVLGELLRGLTRLEVVPYYIFQCRPVTGVKGHFQVPLRKGVKIVDEAKALQNGLGKSVRYVMSHPRGKIEILGESEADKMLFKFHQNKYPADRSKIFITDIKDDATWLDYELNPV
ncbi:KamA family radical SAM protein [Oribacterium sp. WCC10]|uniref:KamA family radical SAM protein n=1 Tax=Oribacterium sp. WCC10 TaxID=1855343 RepID=UPI000B850735|nr:KamA family radical SAM protein [Oribacterium sp. WCC10]